MIKAIIVSFIWLDELFRWIDIVRIMNDITFIPDCHYSGQMYGQNHKWNINIYRLVIKILLRSWTVRSIKFLKEIFIKYLFSFTWNLYYIYNYYYTFDQLAINLQLEYTGWKQRPWSKIRCGRPIGHIGHRIRWHRHISVVCNESHCAWGFSNWNWLYPRGAFLCYLDTYDPDYP